MLKLSLEFTNYLKWKGIKEKTVKLYTMHIRDFCFYLFWHWIVSFEDVTIQDIDNYLQFIRKKPISTTSRYFGKTTEMQTASIQIYITDIKQLFKRLNERKWIWLNHKLIENIKVVKREADYYEEKEIHELADFAEQYESLKIVWMRNKLYILLLYSTWCRANEVLNLTFDDIERQSANILGKWDKYRLIFFTDDIVRLCREYKEERQKPIQLGVWVTIQPTKSNLLFTCFDPKHKDEIVGYETLRKRIKLYSKELWKEYRFHWLRHSFATKLIKKDINLHTIKTLMGHEYITTTQRYLHITNKELENVHKVVFG